MAVADHNASAPKTPSQATAGRILRQETAIPAMAVPMRTWERSTSFRSRLPPGPTAASLKAEYAATASASAATAAESPAGAPIAQALAAGAGRYSVTAMDLAAKLLTVSESVHAGTREDRSGAALEALLVSRGFRVVERRTVPDGVAPVSAALAEMVTGFQGLVVTTGGTGFSPTDLTPEGTRAVLEREAPGLAEAARAVNPLGRLSRGIAGTLGACLVLNVPGSTSGAVESVEAVLDVVPHALELLAGARPH
jgi:molybdenum cofactor synthesis domain-containing protein